MGLGGGKDPFHADKPQKKRALYGGAPLAQHDGVRLGGQHQAVEIP